MPVQPDIAGLNERFENADAPEILSWAWECYGPNIAASSSFQTQSIALLHLIAQVCPEMPVIFLDTGFHFPETLAFREELRKRFALNIVDTQPAIEKSELFRRHGEGLYRQDPDLCCYINKVEPMQRTLKGFDAWMSGVRRDQTRQRRALPVLEKQADGKIKVHPLLHWTKKDLWAYIDRHGLPAHPLFHKGYLSVGCAPCTRPVFEGEDERAGRWAGAQKNECGLHTMDNDPRGVNNDKQS